MRPALPAAFAVTLAALSLGCGNDHLVRIESPDAGATVGAGGTVDAGDAADAGGCTNGATTATSLTTSDSTHRFTGAGPASTAGEVVVTSAGGDVLRLALATDASGAYGITIPLFCGPQTVAVSFAAVACAPRAVVTAVRENCAAPDIQVTLSWDDKGLDFELHLVKPGGRLNDNATDCTWTSCISHSPDWGVVGDSSDDPHKDVDNTGHFGPENIFLHGPEHGTYTVLVEHWGAGAPDSGGEATVLLAGAPAVTIPIVDLASHSVATVATIDWPARTVTAVSTIDDCSANWTGGCRDLLP